MPQMSPMNWMMLYFILWGALMGAGIKVFYTSSLLMLSSTNKKAMKTNMILKV